MKARFNGQNVSLKLNGKKVVVKNSFVLSGTWVWYNDIEIIWNDESLYAERISQNINFTSAGQSFTNINVRTESIGGGGSLCYNDKQVYVCYGFNINRWLNDSHRTVTFTEPQTVSEKFYTLFTANATKRN